ncbi:acyltransferase [Cyclobacterium jeungdonense]|uniref:Acyltransferase n=1 Tax=Cyclobacterium jeungdonense TaxID=708087 RepID=A0ABT8C9L2_9BACT|nr:acyltransferase [Cyclobacterium jeungdonense]MDN3689483.1 acyltransferase [Cyclobacterium jeungdonense]
MKKFVIKILVLIISILPRFIRIFFYDLLKPFSQPIFQILRFAVTKHLFQKCGDNIVIGSNVTFKNWNGIKLGSYVSIHEFCYLDGYGGILIGDKVSIAHNCTIMSSSHTYSQPHLSIRDNPVAKEKVEIGNDIWIGCNVRILGNSIIHDRAVVGACSLVNKTISANSIYYGIPARFYKNINLTNN